MALYRLRGSAWVGRLEARHEREPALREVMIERKRSDGLRAVHQRERGRVDVAPEPVRMRLEDGPGILLGRLVDAYQLDRAARAEATSPLKRLGPADPDQQRRVSLGEHVVGGEQHGALGRQRRQRGAGRLVFTFRSVAKRDEGTRVDEDLFQ